MNEQLQLKLVEILAGIQSATKAAGDFALEQLPDIAQQAVAYGRALHTTALAIGLVVLAVLLFLLPRAKKGLNGDDVWPIPVYIAGANLVVLLVSINLSPALLVWFAPKVWLLKELASLVK